jgi:serine/threonine protein kinase
MTDHGAGSADCSSVHIKNHEHSGCFARLRDRHPFTLPWGVAHMDLKPANILMNTDGRVRLCDFGIVTFVHGALSADFPGPPGFTSPEVRTKRPCETFKTDVWSLGVTMFNLAIERTTKKRPWIENQSHQMGI